MEGRERTAQNPQNILSAEAILSHLPVSFSGEVIVRNSTASTNADAKALAESAGHGTTVIANAQTTARGRLGRDFFAPEGGVYMSMILKVSGIADAMLITSAAAVAVCRAIEAVSEKKPQIKWVNDIMLGGKKVCGILCEAIPTPAGEVDSVVLGIGINYVPVAFPEELADTAGWLFDEPTVSRNVFIAEVMQQVLSMMEEMETRKYIAEYRKRSFVLGKDIRYIENGVWHEAYAADVDENGGLVVVLDSGEKKVLVSGEISVRVK